MLKSVLAAALSCLNLAVRGQPPTDFAAYKEWISKASFEEKKEHYESMSEKFI